MNSENLISRTDSLGETTAYTYDGLGRALTRQNADGRVNYQYDAPSAPNSQGRVTRISYPAGYTAILGYDPVGNAFAREYSVAGLPSTYIEEYQHDLAGRLAHKRLPDGTTISYNYNDGGQLHQVLVDGAEYARFEDHIADGGPGQRILPAGTTAYRYGPEGVLVGMETESAQGAPLQNYAYHYDSAGNVLDILDQRTKPYRLLFDWAQRKNTQISTEDSWSYGYDALHRLTSASFRNQSPTQYNYNEKRRHHPPRKCAHSLRKPHYHRFVSSTATTWHWLLRADKRSTPGPQVHPQCSHSPAALPRPLRRRGQPGHQDYPLDESRIHLQHRAATGGCHGTRESHSQLRV